MNAKRVKPDHEAPFLVVMLSRHARNRALHGLNLVINAPYPSIREKDLGPSKPRDRDVSDQGGVDSGASGYPVTAYANQEMGPWTLGDMPNVIGS